MKGIEQALRNGSQARVDDAAASASRRLAARAGSENLLDVAYGFVESPFGRFLVATTPRGLVRLAFQPEPVDVVLGQLASRVSPRVLEAPEELDEVRRELDEYFEGRRRRFEIPLDWRLSRGFSQRVLRATARIPYGRVSTYGEVAARAGSPRGMRAAGNALGSNPIPIVVPCHRVLRTGGDVGGYGGGPDMKRALLRLEGSLSGPG